MNKNGFISMALVYTFLVIFLFLMLAILRTYIEKDKFLEAINHQIDTDIKKNTDNRNYAISRILEDNAPLSYEKIKLVFPSNNHYGNGNGLFYIDNKNLTDEDNDGKTNRIYFYRGSVKNNHIRYSNLCFRILRTNEDGSIRAVFDGTANSSSCSGDHSSERVSAGNVTFSNNETVSLVDIQEDKIPTYDEANTHSNVIDVLNEWYISNIIENDLSYYISNNTVFCNNKKVFSNSDNTTYYSSKAIMPVFKDKTNRNKYDPNTVENHFSLICSQSTDKYSLTDRTLAYPVGLLTAEDVLLAGGYLTDVDDEYTGGSEGMENKGYYLYTGSTFWTSSAFSKTSSNENNMVAVNSDGYMEGRRVNLTADVIPVISFNSNVRFISGNGTANNPYVIED